MRPPTDKSYKTPAWVLIGLIAIGTAMIYIGARLLQDRMKHAWPW